MFWMLYDHIWLEFESYIPICLLHLLLLLLIVHLFMSIRNFQVFKVLCFSYTKKNAIPGYSFSLIKNWNRKNVDMFLLYSYFIDTCSNLFLLYFICVCTFCVANIESYRYSYSNSWTHIEWFLWREVFFKVLLEFYFFIYKCIFIRFIPFTSSSTF